VREGKESVSYEDWIRYASQTLIQELPVWSTMQKLVNTLKDPLSQSSRTLLMTQFLPSNSSVTVNEGETATARYLTAEGALINTKESQTYEIPSPLVRNLLFRHLNQEIPLRSIPNEPIPCRNKGETIDIQCLFLKAVQSIDRNYMLRSRKYSFKKAQIPGIKKNTPVPQENAYHCVLFRILSQWFFSAPESIELFSEMNAPTLQEKSELKGEKISSSRSRCDFVIDLFKGSHRYAIELVATDTDEEIRNHIIKVENYAKALNADESWVIHFVASIEFDANKLVWPTEREDVNMMYIFHDLNWDEAILVSRATTMEIHQTKIK
jgi:hypothetical protein